ncbi:unnamed protein product [Lampetra planeri]
MRVALLRGDVLLVAWMVAAVTATVTPVTPGIYRGTAERLLLVRRRSRRACRHEPPGLATASLSVSRGQENSFAEVEADFFSLKQSRDAAAAADATEDSLRAGERGEKVLARSLALGLVAKASLGRRLGSRCDRRREPCPAGSSAAAFLAVEAAFGSGVASRTHASLGSLGHCSSTSTTAANSGISTTSGTQQQQQHPAAQPRPPTPTPCGCWMGPGPVPASTEAVSSNSPPSPPLAEAPASPSSSSSALRGPNKAEPLLLEGGGDT